MKELLAASLVTLTLLGCAPRTSRPPMPFGPPMPVGPRPTLGLGPAAPLPDVAPRLPDTARVRVLPVLFFASDAQLADVGGAAGLLTQHLQLAQEHYGSLLGSTFELEGPVATHRSARPTSHFTQVVADTPDDRAHRILAELLQSRREDRYQADVVFMTVFVGTGPLIGGGGRPFNGGPGTGGGYVEMDVASLLRDEGYRFQSTLVHELGHAFGLTHVECHGYPQATNASFMSYNQAHWSHGLVRSATPGILMPEDYFTLALNRRVFPDFVYDARVHGAVDVHRVQACFLGPMAPTIGPLIDQPGVGYELFYDGARMNGPDAALYSRRQAEENCAHAAASATVRVTCKYNGAWFRQ